MATKFEKFRKMIIVGFFCGTLLPLENANAGSCSAPTTVKIDQIRNYIAKHDNLGDPSSLHLLDASASTTCFWKLHFDLPVTNRQVTIYLSPDKQYLSREMLDLAVDPLAEERDREVQLMKPLLAGDPPSRGSSNAPVTIVEFSDFECTYCRRLADVLDKSRAIESGEVRIVFHYFPLRMHPWASSAAQMTDCASSLNESAFWQLYNFFFSNQETLNLNNVREKTIAFVAKNTDIDNSLFKDCVDNHLSAPRIEGDLDLGVRYKVHVTPTFFVNGVRYEGNKDFSQMRAILDAAERGEVWPVIQVAPPALTP